MEAGTSIRAKRVREGRASEASEAKTRDLGPWAGLSASKQLRSGGIIDAGRSWRESPLKEGRKMHGIIELQCARHYTNCI